jgi:hypothetical protein
MNDHPTHPIAIAPPRIAAALIDLADCVCNQLAVNGAGPTCWCGLYPGAAVSWEYCGECGSGTCGMGYVRLTGVFPYEVFPVPTVDFHCAKPIAYSIEVGALRCVPQPSDGHIIEPVAMAEIVLAQVLDAQALLDGIRCCELEVAAERYQPVGPDGGCVGGFWTAYLAID